MTSNDRNEAGGPLQRGELAAQRTGQPAQRMLPATPALRALIERVRARITRLVWLHGLGTIAAAAAAWLLFAFLADWTMHLPRAVRVVHLAILIGLPAWLVVRALVRPLRARPDASGTAVLIERAHPELKELLVSAVELETSARPSGAPELVDGVLRQAEGVAARLDTERVLAPRGPRLRFALGAAASAVCALVLLANAEAAAIFFRRIAGGSTAWPQRTHLSIEIPSSSGAPRAGALDADAAAAQGEIVAHIARGSDVPVLVRVAGEVPEEVTLHFAGGHKSVLAASGGPLFRTLLRSVQEETEFYVTGGDDEDEWPRARLVVLQPPDVAGLAVEIEPPAYSTLPARIEFDRDVEVLAGSRIVVHVLPDPADATGVARLLPEDRVLALLAAPFPSARSDEPGAAPGTPRAGLAFEIVAEKSLRYRFELADSTGLSNPDPGLFGIAVVEDRPPEVEILSPGRGDFDTVIGGLIALRARAEDDFGLARMSWDTSVASESGSPEAGLAHELAWTPIESDPASGSTSEPGPRTLVRRGGVVRASAIARQRIEVAELSRTEPVAEGQQFQLVVAATDNREPEAHVGRAVPVRIRVVSTDEFLRRTQDRLTRAQGAAAALGELQRQKLRQTLDVLAGLESDEPEPDTGTSANEIAAALTGERRVQGDARALARDLAGLAEAVLYARVDERAGALLERLDQELAASLERSFDPAPWRTVAGEKRAGALGTSGLAGKLVDIVGVALEVSEEHATGATEALARAQEAVDVAETHAELSAAVEAEKQALARVEQLLEMLAEWDNFQSVLSLTRDILSGQKGLSERTKALEQKER